MATRERKPLSQELDYFEENKASLLEEHKGKFALVKGRKLIGTFNKQEQAFAEGVKKFGDKPFLVKLIIEDEPVAQLPALSIGVLRASF